MSVEEMDKYLTKREMVEAMLAGKRLFAEDGGEAWFDPEKASPWRYLYTTGEEGDLLYWAWGGMWRVKEDPPKPRMRPMTRDEILGFLANTPGIVARYDGDTVPYLATSSKLAGKSTYEWATVTLDGEIGEWHHFEKEVPHE